jgi:hypothetical protein
MIMLSISPEGLACLHTIMSASLLSPTWQNKKNQASPSRQMSGKGSLMGVTLPLQGG